MVCIFLIIFNNFRKVSDIVNRFSLSILNCNEYLNVLIKTGDIVNKRSGNVSFFTLNPKKHKKLLSKQ